MRTEIRKVLFTAGISPVARTNSTNVSLIEVHSEKTNKDYLYVLNFTDKNRSSPSINPVREFPKGTYLIILSKFHPWTTTY